MGKVQTKVRASSFSRLEPAKKWLHDFLLVVLQFFFFFFLVRLSTMIEMAKGKKHTCLFWAARFGYDPKKASKGPGTDVRISAHPDHPGGRQGKVLSGVLRLAKEPQKTSRNPKEPQGSQLPTLVMVVVGKHFAILLIVV